MYGFAIKGKNITGKIQIVCEHQYILLDFEWVHFSSVSDGMCDAICFRQEYTSCTHQFWKLHSNCNDNQISFASTKRLMYIFPFHRMPSFRAFKSVESTFKLVTVFSVTVRFLFILLILILFFSAKPSYVKKRTRENKGEKR